MSAGNGAAGRYIVRVTNRAKTQHYECPTDDRDEAEQYARTAIEDGCHNATVILSGGGGLVVSWWNQVELDGYKRAHPDWQAGPLKGDPAGVST